jgi:hypothetical protein
MKILVPFLLVVVGFCLAPALAQSDKSEREGLRGRFYMVVWAYQGAGNAPRDSHTFATFYDGNDLADGRVAPATISWFPATGIVRPLGVERGHNFSLAQTLGMACRSGKQLKWWGPYEITLGLYRWALARISLLKSGKVSYSLMSLRPGTMNCIEAAGDITDTPFRPGLSWGFAASAAVVRHLSPFFKNGKRISGSVAGLLISSKCGEQTVFNEPKARSWTFLSHHDARLASER